MVHFVAYYPNIHWHLAGRLLCIPLHHIQHICSLH
ncbi:hypothetical protein Hamer_G012155 [Homarus americanus]|uniref:Uncharacterized protein n=1 Tax=Homarus americanus TaxID=6706 RepID=A0A8J5JDV6_HOMAM|nr:hypothetical protein Hamer_G012155 [Homarus americanus]